MKLIKGFVVSLVLFAGISAVAEEGDFATHKAEVLKHVDGRIQNLQEHKTCVNSAANRDGLKDCRAKMKDEHQDRKAHRLERRKERLEKRADRLEQKN